MPLKVNKIIVPLVAEFVSCKIKTYSTHIYLNIKYEHTEKSSNFVGSSLLNKYVADISSHMDTVGNIIP